MTARAHLIAPEPSPLPSELAPLNTAHAAGRQSREAGFRVLSNCYMDPVLSRPQRGEELKAWAWDLGWREADWMARREMTKNGEEVRE